MTVTELLVHMPFPSAQALAGCAPDTDLTIEVLRQAALDLVTVGIGHLTLECTKPDGTTVWWCPGAQREANLPATQNQRAALDIWRVQQAQLDAELQQARNYQPTTPIRNRRKQW